MGIRSQNKRSAAPRSNAARLFGYDLFISFALGPPPRGTQSYASDLARRLRERDFIVFFSEDEAAPGEQLDSTLLTALHRSRTLVVIANRETLENPRWVRREVEEFAKRHPSRAVIPINISQALQYPTFAGQTHQWLLQSKDRIWLDESQDAAEHGIVSEALIERLATAPARYRSNVRWRWLVRTVLASLTILTIALALAVKLANDARARADDARKQADQARVRADDARGRAEDLVQFMLFDLSTKLKAIGHLELMDGVNAKVESYYRNLTKDSNKQGMVMEYDQAASLVSQGDTLLAEGKSKEARRAYSQGFEIVSRLVKANAANAEWWSELSVINDRLGDLDKLAGSLDDAHNAYQDSLAIRQRLTKLNPARGDWNRNLWVSYNKVSDVYEAKGQLDAARDNIQRGLAVAENLAALDRSDTSRQLDLAASFEKLGDVEVKALRFDKAASAYTRSLRIREAVNKLKPGDALLQRDLAMSNRELGDALNGAGQTSSALQAYQKSLALMQQLVKSDPRNAGWQHDLGALHLRIGDIELNRKEEESAITHFKQAWEIGQRLVTEDPGNDEWQGDLSVTYERLGVIFELHGQIPDALALYQRGRAISQRLAARNPGNPLWKSDLAWVNRKIAQLEAPAIK